jgi:tetrapyrrole methylase family protein/MazG family protein
MADDRISAAIRSLVDLVGRLRGPGGCPWDAKQTDDTLKIYLIEEAYEVLDAIEGASPKEVCSELGDLLFQILFLAHLASERKEFDFADVVETITRKMIRRHPHVFGDAQVESADDVASNWARIKQSERGSCGDIFSSLQKVPSGSPALLRAHRMGERAAKAGFDWGDADEVWTKVEEEMGEMRTAMVDGDSRAMASELGDLLFTLTNLARHWGENAENLLRKANEKFLRRFERMERRLTDSGIRLEDATLDQMNAAWEDIKECEV